VCLATKEVNLYQCTQWYTPFDCDDTLAIQGAPFPGPIPMYAIIELRNQGNPTGIIGNFLNFFKYYPDGWRIMSFFGPTELQGTSIIAHHQYKHLALIRTADVLKASRYVMVGNKMGDKKARPGSQDDVQARLAKWEFISETDFANGRR
jgi:hypothetical protein